ncbi:hypothetical protein LshimejAT787_0409220 [Lyophyllum shimeji]|uniref:Uncharacterized protein n=1 Tax=Lyophyllum shimeji TaxID=47721 RepID=A0A9P3UP25_LYOSH|nr:hypothetical protein LshimejAT787_0409220 [Lyophyllum shimeji]
MTKSPESGSGSSHTNEQKSSKWSWAPAKGVVKSFGNFLAGEGGSQQKDVGEDRSFEAALHNSAEVTARCRYMSNLGPQPAVIHAQGIASEGRAVDVAVVRPDDTGELSSWEAIEPRLPPLEERGVYRQPMGSIRIENEQSTHGLDNHDDRNRQQPNAERLLAQCERDKESISETLKGTIAKLMASESRGRELEEEVRRLHDELKSTKKDLRQAEERRRDAERRQCEAEAHYEQTARLLEETTAELKGATLFLTKTDALSSADVAAMIDGLNAEIKQLAAFMADTLDERGTGREMHTPVNSNERVSNIRNVGEPLVQFLRDNRTQRLDPMAVQISLQLCLADACFMVVESWQPGNWRADDALWDVYSSIKTNSIQSVSGRWRAITRSQTQYHECQHSVFRYFRRRVREILSLAGWPSDQPENREFLGRFEERLKQIVTLALRLHKAIGDVTSGDLRAVMLPPNALFNPEVMDDAFPDDEKAVGVESSNADTIASGTTDLGLWRIEGGESIILRKPKVVRLSALEVMLGGH